MRTSWGGEQEPLHEAELFCSPRPQGGRLRPPRPCARESHGTPSCFVHAVRAAPAAGAGRCGGCRIQEASYLQNVFGAVDGRAPDQQVSSQTRSSCCSWLTATEGSLRIVKCSREVVGAEYSRGAADFDATSSACTSWRAHTYAIFPVCVRCTIAGDQILVTAIDQNRLIAPLALGTGRSLVGLVQDAERAGEVDKVIDAACGSAVEHGWFNQLTKADVSVSGATLPATVFVKLRGKY